MGKVNPMEHAYDYDVLVIGAGHAGTEAAHIAAQMGARTALLTTNLDTVGQMSCNPAIGGVGKGQMVREIDALGGIMGLAIDRTGIQFRMLNRSKGPAMHGPRAQADKKAYQQEVKRLIECQPQLDLRQEIVDDLLIDPRSHAITGIAVRGGAIYRAPRVVLTTGTFLQALMHTGEAQTPGGRAGEGTTHGISSALGRLGVQLLRFKTGTPPRLNGRTIDYQQCELQPGDDQIHPFSYLHDSLQVDQLPCWITYTDEAVHEVIRENLHRAPMYSGQIQSTGPRYCPSIEDKVVRFADKGRHQLFLEPEGRQTLEVYVNGVSTSLPRDVQDRLLRMIPGLQRAQVMRYGYAVEYDYAPPEQLWPSLESKIVPGLYFAGQINGTTGYEEAGAQGLMAGINAALSLQGREPLVLSRDQAYIGVMIDDLVTRGVDEPYRMFTSRAEYRLRLRQDNADRRLTPLAIELGCADVRRQEHWRQKEAELSRAAQWLRQLKHDGVTLEKWLRRPETTWDQLVAWAPEPLITVTPAVAEQLVFDAKYDGYVQRQDQEVERQRRLADKSIPAWLDYAQLTQLRPEAKEKLGRIRPQNLDQASRISGITPADLALVLAHISGKNR
ncbi:MAG: tRNA uridine-5-carboxymethylaminomethyl(34) synthesis enzyme MnmG [Pirellulales bacterium]